MVPANSTAISRVAAYSGADSTTPSVSRTGLSPALARHSSRFRYITSSSLLSVLLPRHTHCYAAGLGSAPFDRLYLGYRVYFLFLRVLRCFSSPGSPQGFSLMPESLPAGCPIRKSAGQWVFAPRRRLSQLITSFVASESQGIPHAPL